MKFPLHLLVPARFRRLCRPAPPARPRPGPPPIAIDFTSAAIEEPVDLEITDLVTPERMTQMRRQARLEHLARLRAQARTGAR